MAHSLKLAAVRITLGAQYFYIPAAQVQHCALVDDGTPDIPRLSQWLGLPDELEQGLHLHLWVPASKVDEGWHFWGELENVTLQASDIFPLPELVKLCSTLPALRALVNDSRFSPLLSW